MTDDIDRIVAELRMGHRSVLKSAKPTADGRVLVPSMLGSLNAAVGWPKGLVAYYSAYLSRLTPLGLVVRARIIEMEKGND